MAEAINKLERLLEIVRLLQEKAWSTTELATRFNSNERAIQRDLKVLREAGGFHIENPKRGYHRIPPSPSSLNLVESLAVHAATRLLYHHTPAYNPYYQESELKK